MKFRFLVRIIDAVLHVNLESDEPRADVYLPTFLLAFGLVLIGGGAAVIVGYFIVFNIWLLVGGIIAVPIGILAVICWRNQTVKIISDDEFVYTTFLGNSYTYKFSDITGIKLNSDSQTLFIGEKKVHIEMMSIMSDRFVELVNQALERLNQQ